VFVAITATGYNLVDLGAAERRGVVVSNVPEYGTQTVAQFTMALLLELCHHVGAHWRSVAAGDWARCPDFGYWLTPQIELAGKTMGIVGAGRIGRQVASLARAFGMQVLAAGRPGGAVSAEPFDRACPIEQLFEASDVVSLHCPLAPDTEGLVERSRLARMKREALLINTSRGGLVVERDLAEALNSGALAGAAVDVVSVEPIREDNPLLSARNCLITPHMAWASREARRRLLAATVANVEAFLAGTPKNVVSRKLLDSAHRAT
jgi:glycerate dehydrogenase